MSGEGKRDLNYQLDLLNMAIQLCMPEQDPYYGLWEHWGGVIVDKHACALYVPQDHALHKTLTEGKPGLMLRGSLASTSEFKESTLQNIQTLTPLLQKADASDEEMKQIRQLITQLHLTIYVIVPNAYSFLAAGGSELDNPLVDESLMKQYFEPTSHSFISPDDIDFLLPSWVLATDKLIDIESLEQTEPYKIIFEKIEQAPFLAKETIRLPPHFQEQMVKGVLHASLETIQTYSTSLQKMLTVIFPEEGFKAYLQKYCDENKLTLTDKEQEKVKLLGTTDLPDQQEQIQKQGDAHHSSSSSRKNT